MHIFQKLLVCFCLTNYYRTAYANWNAWNGWTNCELKRMTGRTVRTRHRSCVTGVTCTDGEPTAIDFAGIPCVQSDASMYGQNTQPTSLVYDSAGTFMVYMKYSEVLNYNSKFQIDTFTNEDSLGLPTASIDGYSVTASNTAETDSEYHVMNDHGIKIRSTMYRTLASFGSRISLTHSVATDLKPVIAFDTTAMVTTVMSFSREYNHEPEYETYFVNQNIFTRPSDSGRNTVLKFSEDAKSIGIPGRPSLFSPRIKFSRYSRDVKLIFHFDMTFQLDTMEPPTFLHPFISSVERYPERNKMILTLSTVISNGGGEYGMDVLVQATKRNIDYNSRTKHHAYMRMVRCKNADPCTDSLQLNIKKSRLTNSFDSVEQTGVGWPELGYRIKSKRTGKCLELNTDNKIIEYGSKCRDNFVLTSDSRLIHKATGKEIGYYTGGGTVQVDSNTASNYPVSFSQKKHLLMYFNGYWNCMGASPSHNRAFFTYRVASIRDVCSGSDTVVFNLLQGYSDDLMNKIGMKGILKVDSPLGMTVVLCQPTGDLAKQFNCYYSLELTSTWKGISPSMTFIGFYIASTNLFYGYCYQGKHYCSYDIQKDLSTPISENDYIALLGDVNMVSTEKLDDIALAAQATTETSFNELAARSHTLFFKITGAWHSRVVFRN